MSRDKWFVSTASESDARAAALLPMAGSEDRRDLLPLPALPVREEKSEYAPNPAIHWIVEIALAEPTTQKRLTELFPLEDGCMLYGRSDGRWSFATPGVTEIRFDRLKWAMRLLERGDGWQPRSAIDLARFAAKARRIAVGAASVETPLSASEGAKRSAALLALAQSIDEDLIVRIEGDFEGRAIWDAMMSLGLHWGDGDWFHWENRNGVGDDHHFSVWTSSEPGYFLPELIAAGQMRAQDLIFGMSLPRCGAPLHVANAMVNAAGWVARRLGGTFAAPSLSPVERTAERMVQHGIAPGSDAALLLF